MKYAVETDLNHFDFWGQAKSTASTLTSEELDELENFLTNYYFEGQTDVDNMPTDTSINDIFAYEQDWLAEQLGYTDWEELEADRDEKALFSWVSEHYDEFTNLELNDQQVAEICEYIAEDTDKDDGTLLERLEQVIEDHEFYPCCGMCKHFCTNCGNGECDSEDGEEEAINSFDEPCNAFEQK